MNADKTKRELAAEIAGCLKEIHQMTSYFEDYSDALGEYDPDDVIGDADCAADDIAVYLGELRALLREAGMLPQAEAGPVKQEKGG